MQSPLLRAVCGIAAVALVYPGAGINPVAAVPVVAAQPSTTNPSVDSDVVQKDALDLVKIEHLGQKYNKPLKALYDQNGDAWKRAESRKDGRAVWLLALCQLLGISGPPDANGAATRLKLAADAGFSPAVVDLGQLLADSGRNEEAVALFRKSAEGGDPRAMYLFGNANLQGLGTVKNESQAKYWFRSAINAGDPRAMWAMGVMTLNGDGGAEKDEHAGAEMILKSADAGCPQAMIEYANCLMLVRGVLKDEREALNWYRKAADLDSEVAMYRLALCYFDGKGVKADEAQGRNWLNKAVEAQSVEAMMYLAELSAKGEHGYPKDSNVAGKWITQAAQSNYPPAMVLLASVLQTQPPSSNAKIGFDWLTRAASLGNVEGMYKLGLAYKQGLGTSVNAEASAKWFKSAADAGNTSALVELGDCYSEGRGVPKSTIQAFGCYTKAAEAGDTNAMGKVGDCYMTGSGASKDMTEALHWYRKAADLGDSRCMNNLAVSYANGFGTTKDDAEAFKWYKAAADKGFVEAINSVGACYTFGSGTTRDLAEALKWYQRAADLGSYEGIHNLAFAHVEGRGVPKDPARGFQIVSDASKKFNTPEVLLELATFYEHGIGTEQNIPEALRIDRQLAQQGSVPAMVAIVRLAEAGQQIPQAEVIDCLTKASSHGDAGSMMKLGLRILNGDGMPKNDAQGVGLLFNAAKGGDLGAILLMAKFCETGEHSVQTDIKQALTWYQFGAQHGSKECMNELGRLYQNGIGVPKDLGSAAQWYQRSAQAGSTLAMCNLAAMLESGVGVQQDYKQAGQLYLLAAQGNEPVAMYRLGVMYGKGQGVPADNNEATKWIRLAAQKGNADAQALLKSNGLSW